MATVKFFIKNRTKKAGSINNPFSIYVRFTHGRKIDFTKSTQLTVLAEHWNNKKGEPKKVTSFLNKENLQKSLDKLSGHLSNAYNNDITNGVVINSNWLQTQIDKCFERTIVKEDDTDLVSVQTQRYINELPTKPIKDKVGASESTIKNYKSFLSKINQYDSHTKEPLRLKNLNITTQKKFIEYLLEVDKLGKNTAGKYFKYLKVICNDAVKNGVETHPDYTYIKGFTEKVSIVFLNEDEIQTLFELELKNESYLDNARDWLIIGVWTALRVSDLLILRITKLVNGKFELRAKKTDKLALLPIHPHVRHIINKHGGEFPRAISDQKFNEYIKNVCKIAGFTEILKGSKMVNISPKNTKPVIRKKEGHYAKWELVTTHICRRSFATNLYGKLPTPTIMNLTGHTSEIQFLKYIGKTFDHSANSVQDFWDNQ